MANATAIIIYKRQRLGSRREHLSVLVSFLQLLSRLPRYWMYQPLSLIAPATIIHKSLPFGELLQKSQARTKPEILLIDQLDSGVPHRRSLYCEWLMK